MPKFTEEQLSAIETEGSNIIVSAGAGSGKTQVLTQRVIRLLKKGIHINELLILTFTKAAASEMKDRIRKEIINNKELNEEIKYLSSSYITTFDSYSLSVVKKYSYLLNLSPNIGITDEGVIRLQEIKILDKLFEELYASPTKIFEKLIDKYCVKNDKQLKKNILELYRKIDSYIDKEEYLENIKNNYFTETNINKILDTYIKVLESKRKIVSISIDRLDNYFDNSYTEKVRENLTTLLTCDINDLNLITKVEIPKVPNNSSDESKEAKQYLKKSVDDLLYFSSFGNVDNIRSTIYASKETVLEIVNIVKNLIKNVEIYKKEHDIYTFTDIACLSLKLLENKSVREEIKHSFKEIMVDEYQDTSDIQERFINLISNNNVYMVGDIKQSIYRFRGTNPNIFKDKYDAYTNKNNGVKIDLTKNFRSRSEVLNSINKIFGLLMDDNIGGASYKISHEMVYGNTLYDTEKDNINYDTEVVEYESVDGYTDNEIEIFTICNDIKNKLKNKLKVFDKELGTLRTATYNDFVIILDRSKYFDDYKKVFEYMGVPLTILKDEKLNVTSELSLIKNIIDIILRINNKDYGKEFKYDLMSIGRSFLYELTDQELYDILTKEEYYDSKVYKDFATITSLNSKTIPELLEEILDITDFYNKIYKVGGFNNKNILMKSILEMGKALNDLGYGIEEFKEYLEETKLNGIDVNYKEPVSQSESVKIMTIHKSKGLEYPICYFADLCHNFNTSDLKRLFISDKKYGLIIPDALDDENKTSILKELYKLDYYQEEISEKLRLFYVALTRAREKIIIVTKHQEDKQLYKDEYGVIENYFRKDFNKLSDFISSVKYYLSSYFKEVNIDNINLTKNYLYKKEITKSFASSIDDIIVEEINIDNTLIEEEHYSKETKELVTKEETNNMNFGTKIHEVFELIDLKNFDESLIDDEFIKEKVKSFLSNDLLKNIQAANIYHEYEFIYTLGDTEYHGIIDLMIEYTDHIDIIDFKLKNVLDERYKEQLNGYKKYIESITNKKVNTYLYSIIDEKITTIS